MTLEKDVGSNRLELLFNASVFVKLFGYTAYELFWVYRRRIAWGRNGRVIIVTGSRFAGTFLISKSL